MINTIAIKRDGSVMRNGKEIGTAKIMGKTYTGTAYTVHAFDENKKAVVYGREMVKTFFEFYTNK